MLSQDQISRFQKKIIDFYQQKNRRFAWRITHDPYHILVSEFMLQQTQTNRVQSKYEQFLQQFQKIQDCANASFSAILTVWQGLGYNRRAKYLHETTKIIVEEYGGIVPCDEKILSMFPGIGPYTAAAICTFSYNKPLVFIETNIRTVFINEFFLDQNNIHDKDIMPFIKETLLEHSPRLWYYALMDYGVFLKKSGNNKVVQSVHYTKQSKFRGSKRELRGMIIKLLVEHGSINRISIEKYLEKNDSRIFTVLQSLFDEQLLEQCGDQIRIKNG